MTKTSARKKAPARSGKPPARSETDRLLAELKAAPAYKGWNFIYVYPGFFAYHQGRYTVFFTPDWEGDATLPIQVQLDDGDVVSEYSRILPLPHRGRSGKQLQKLVRPTLDAISKATRAPAPSRSHSTMKRSPAQKSPAQLDREIAAALATKQSPPPGLTHGAQWPKDRRYMLVDDKTGKDMRPALDFEVDQIQASRHGVKAIELRGGVYSVRLRDRDEVFAVKDRDGNILGESKSAKGAMELAPKDKSYAIVRGEYTSDGRYWGPGSGRTMAVREFHPTGGFRWYVG